MATSTVSYVSASESAERNPWDQIADESSKAFHAFTLYRDAGWNRSVKKVVDELKKSAALIYRWSVAHDWRGRAQAWDEFNDQVNQAQMVKARLEMNKATLQITRMMQAKALQGYLALQPTNEFVNPRTGEKEHRLNMKPSDLVRLLESSHKLSRDVLGKGDEDQVAKIELIFGRKDNDDEDEVGTPT